ncbi:MAG TPA: DUF5818 domain-containing protein [Thermoanaerobaculia bacterium]|nr:DUF5818 domain-containing protein [Thermoanaerobaculia bacterium]
MNRRWNWLSRIVSGGLLAATLLLPGTAAAQGRKIQAAGTLNVEGRCRILTDDAGRQYGLVGNLGAFTTGDRIRVVGTRGEPSSCVEGTTIRVESARQDVPRQAARQLNRVVARSAAPAGGNNFPLAAAILRQDGDAGNTGNAGDTDNTDNTRDPGKGKGEISVRGTLTAEGTECQALRGTDGRLYTLTGNLRGYNVGDRVQVVGTRPQASTCQQGITLSIKHIEHEKIQGDEPTAHLKGEVLHLVGALTADGAVCQAFRAQTGETYSLTGDLKGLQAGDRVGLSGTVVEGSTCQEPGTPTLQVKTIRKIK